MSHTINTLRSILLLSLLSVLVCRAQSVAESANPAKSLKYAYLNDIEINYEMIGYGDKKIVLVHGFGTSLHTWDDIKDLFPKAEFTLYLIDLKGFGKSSKPEDGHYTIQDQSKLVEQFIKDIATDSLYLIGHSYGGAVALLTQIDLLKEKSKTKISKLILIDCLAYMQDVPAFMEYLRIPLLNKLTFLMPNKFRAEYILNKIYFNKNMVTEKLVDRYSDFYDGDHLAYSYITSARQIDDSEYDTISESYKKIPTECLIIWGKDDPILPLKNGFKLSKELLNARIEIISECGHVPQEEKPQATFGEIYSFIKER